MSADSSTLYCGSMDGRVSILLPYYVCVCVCVLHLCVSLSAGMKWFEHLTCNRFMLSYVMYIKESTHFAFWSKCVCFQGIPAVASLTSLLLPGYWGVESGEVELVSGPGHTNLVCSMVATPDALYTLGVDKSLKTISTGNNEFK